MRQSDQLTLKFISVRVSVKFACSLYLQAFHQRLTQNVPVSSGIFNIDQKVTLSIPSHHEDAFLQIKVFLATEHSTYNCGVIKLELSLLEQPLIGSRILSLPLMKCLSKNASAEIEIVEGLQRSKDELLSQQFLKKSQECFEQNQSQFLLNRSKTVRNSIVEQIESQHLKQKIESLQKQNSHKNIKIRELEQENEKLKLALSESENMLKKCSFDSLESGRKLNRLEKEFKDLEQELHESRAVAKNSQIQLEALAEKQFIQFEMSRKEEEDRFYEQIELLSQQIKQLELANFENQEEGEKMNQKIRMLTERLKEKQSLVALQEIKLQEVNNKNDDLAQKLRQAELNYQRACTQKKSLQVKHAEMQRELEQRSTLKRTNSLIQQQLSLLKRNSERFTKAKYLATIADLTDQYKEERASLVHQNQQLAHELKLAHQVKEQLSEQLKVHEQSVQDYYGNQKSCQSRLGALKKQNQQLQAEITSISSINERLRQENEELLKKIQKFTEDSLGHQKQLLQLKSTSEHQLENVCKLEAIISELKLDNEKLKIAVEMNETFEAKNHFPCHQVECKLRKSVEEHELIVAELSLALAEAKARSLQNENLLREFHLEKSRGKDNSEKNESLADKAEKKVSLLEQQLKEKQNMIAKLLRDRKEKTDTIKQYQANLQAVKSDYHSMLSMNNKFNSQELTRSSKIQQLELQIEKKNARIQRLQIVEIEANKELKMAQQKNVRVQNQVKSLQRQAERKSNKSRQLIESVISLSIPDMDPVEELISEHRSIVSKFTNRINILSQQLLFARGEVSEKNKAIEKLSNEMSQFESEISRCFQQIEQLKETVQVKQMSLTNLASDHNELLSIHEEYILAFNRYKLDKEQETKMLKSDILSFMEANEVLKQEAMRKQEQSEEKNKKMSSLEEKVKELELRIGEKAKQLHSVQNELQLQKKQVKGQCAKVAKLLSQLKLKEEELAQFEIKNEFLSQANVELQAEKNEIKQMLMNMTKFKQKAMKESHQKNEVLMQLQTEKDNLGMMIDGLQSEKQVFLNEQTTLKNKVKELQKLTNSLKHNLTDCNQNYAKLKCRYEEKAQSLEAVSKKLLEQEEEASNQKKKQNAQLKQQHEKLEAALLQLKQAEQRIQSARIKENQLIQKWEDCKKEKNDAKKQYENLVSSHLKLEDQNALIKMELMKESRMNEQLSRRLQELAEQVKQKEESLFAVTGRMHEVQIQFANEQRKMKVRFEQIQEEWNYKYEYLKETAEQKQNETQILLSSRALEVKRLNEEMRLKNKKIEKMEKDMKQLEALNASAFQTYQKELESTSKNSKEAMESLRAELRKMESECKEVKQQLSINKETVLKYQEEKNKNLLESESERSSKIRVQQQSGRKERQRAEEHTKREIKKQICSHFKSADEPTTKGQFDKTLQLQSNIIQIQGQVQQ